MSNIESDFVGVFDGYFTDEFCDSAISYFENMNSAGLSFDRQSSENVTSLVKKDDSIFTASEKMVHLDQTIDIQNQFNSIFWDKIYVEYRNKYGILDQLPRHVSIGFKVQKTEPSGGYHIWHCEHANGSHANRLMFYILYLNDVEEGGETEFLYLKKRIKPTKGTLVLAPASYTHTHRGNPPLSGDKYIITGWVEYQG